VLVVAIINSWLIGLYVIIVKSNIFVNHHILLTIFSILRFVSTFRFSWFSYQMFFVALLFLLIISFALLIMQGPGGRPGFGRGGGGFGAAAPSSSLLWNDALLLHSL
jgi:hypothetical protein